MLEFVVGFARNYTRTHVKKTATLLAVLSAFAGVSTVALPAAAQSKPSIQKVPIVREEPIAEELSIYEQAAAELPENYYILYRIVERMARLNHLDNLPWRVGISSVNEESRDCINAFASQANLIYLCKGTIDRVAGDASALACVVGHEMAHHQLQHIPAESAEWYSRIQEIEKIEDEDDREKRAEELFEHMNEFSRSQESEADATGYQYMVTAGFEPEGCIRLLNVFSRLPGSRIESSHPAVSDRIEAIERLITEQSSLVSPDITYKQLETSQPLTYEWLEEEKQLRIDSRRGGSIVRDLENLFGQTAENL